MKHFLLLLVVLFLFVLPAAAAEETPYTLVAEALDWGEAITRIEIENLDGEFKAEDFAVSTTVTYFSYSTFSMVTEEATRTVEKVDQADGKTVLHLATAFGDTVKVYQDSTKNYVITLKGETIGPCKALVNKAIDAFVEGEAADVNYRLYVPQTEKPAPLVLWLHGGGEGGRDNRIQIGANLVTNWITPENQAIFGEGGAFILAPQYNETTNRHNPVAIKAVLDEVTAKYPVDVKRLYVGGCSMGGMGTHDMIVAYPDLFAAAFPICPANTLTEEDAALLAKSGMKVHYTHSIDDTTCPVTNSIVSANRLNQAGAQAHMTFFDRVRCEGLTAELGDMLGHWSWVYVHRNYDCLGEDYDGQNYHPGEYATEAVTQLYDGVLFDMTKVDRSAEGYKQNDNTTWIYDGAPYDASKETILREEVTGTSVAPKDLGYDSFFAWLAAQSK